MSDIDYSVVIRTTGKAKEKYNNLLQSISELDPLPKQIIVVLPNGFDLPDERLGWETYYYSEKGMVTQRLKGIAECKTHYALICDDDISFPKDFVAKLHKPIEEGVAELSVGPLFSFLPQKGMPAFLCMIMATAMPTLFHKDRYVSVLKSSGYSYNRYLVLRENHYYETLSAAWTCFYGRIDSMKDIHLEEEKWLDVHGYSAFDDQTMFYKGYLKGIRTVVVADALYEHLDAGTSRKGNDTAVTYSKIFNRIVFWDRFIYSQQKTLLSKAISKVCLNYLFFMDKLLEAVKYFGKQTSKEHMLIKKQAKKDAYNYLLSQDYQKLSVIG